jgi:hypothetical protein
MNLKPRTWLALAAAALIAALVLSACGSSKKKSSSSPSGGAGGVAVTVTESGKTAKYAVAAGAKGGLTTVKVTNQGKMPHSGQLVLIQGGHTTQEALKILAAANASSKPVKIPSWLRAEGGVPATPPGQTGTASLDLPGGKYLVMDEGGPGSSGPPAYVETQIAAGSSGPLPSTPSTVTANSVGKDKYRWDQSGAPLKTGIQNITFVSKGKDALHIIGAFRVIGNPSKAELLKGIGSNGPPPKFIDQTSFFSTPVIDGGKSQTLNLDIKKPGTWVLFCPITDRDGGKPHFQEGLLKEITVK